MNKWCCPPDLFAGRCVEGGIAGGGVSTSAGDASVELEDLLVKPSVSGSSPFW